MESLNISYPFSYTYAGNTVKYNYGKDMQDNQMQAQWIYAAATMDGDGCFMIRKYNRQTGPYYLPVVKICMINDGAINYIQKETGLGRIHITGTRPSRPNSKPLYEWTITNQADLITFLEGIMPYLRNKKDRAAHLLSFCKNRDFRPYGNRYRRFDQDELDYREDMYVKMRELNGNKAAATTEPPGPERACDSLIS